jgi:tRNA(adenine34) deaminase
VDSSDTAKKSDFIDGKPARILTRANAKAKAKAKAAGKQSSDYFMRLALKEAAKAQEAGEVPVGAVIVKNGKAVAKGFNRCIIDSDPTAHAEIAVLRKAARKLNNYRLTECEIYVTVKPCAMCMQALKNARIIKLFYGAPQAKKTNSKMQIKGGILKKECAAIIKNFFIKKRKDGSLAS